eukprot:GHVN01082955.1.p1 GENE.GHVN01082955.1~~GHVN01082955.1.p1  ORF type:complete len:628 (-),score=99.71 GHVN01082955.1:1471-3354(-)
MVFRQGCVDQVSSLAGRRFTIDVSGPGKGVKRGDAYSRPSDAYSRHLDGITRNLSRAFVSSIHSTRVSPTPKDKKSAQFDFRFEMAHLFDNIDEVSTLEEAREKLHEAKFWMKHQSMMGEHDDAVQELYSAIALLNEEKVELTIDLDAALARQQHLEVENFEWAHYYKNTRSLRSPRIASPRTRSPRMLSPRMLSPRIDESSLSPSSACSPRPELAQPNPETFKQQRDMLIDKETQLNVWKKETSRLEGLLADAKLKAAESSEERETLLRLIKHYVDILKKSNPQAVVPMDETKRLFGLQNDSGVLFSPFNGGQTGDASIEATPRRPIARDIADVEDHGGADTSQRRSPIVPKLNLFHLGHNTSSVPPQWSTTCNNRTYRSQVQPEAPHSGVSIIPPNVVVVGNPNSSKTPHRSATFHRRHNQMNQTVEEAPAGSKSRLMDTNSPLLTGFNPKRSCLNHSSTPDSLPSNSGDCSLEMGSTANPQSGNTLHNTTQPNNSQANDSQYLNHFSTLHIHPPLPPLLPQVNGEVNSGEEHEFTMSIGNDIPSAYEKDLLTTGSAPASSQGSGGKGDTDRSERSKSAPLQAQSLPLETPTATTEATKQKKASIKRRFKFSRLDLIAWSSSRGS